MQQTTLGVSPQTASRESTNIPSNLLVQLTTYLQQATNTHQRTTPGTSHTMMEDQLSEVSELLYGSRRELPTAIANVVPPPQLNPQPVINPPRPAVTGQDAALPTDVATHKPSLPPVTPRILDKIRKIEHIDFGTLTLRAIFGTPERTTQTSFTLELTPSGNSFAIQPTCGHKRITSFLAWLETWNIFLAIMVDHNPAKASQLIAYQAIITSPCIQYPLHAWLPNSASQRLVIIH